MSGAEDCRVGLSSPILSNTPFVSTLACRTGIGRFSVAKLNCHGASGTRPTPNS